MGNVKANIKKRVRTGDGVELIGVTRCFISPVPRVIDGIVMEEGM